MPVIQQNEQLFIGAGQTRGLLDIPTRDAHPLRIDGFTASALDPQNGVVSDVTTILESNGFFLKPVPSGKPDVVLLTGATLRIIATKAAPVQVPTRVVVTLNIEELP